ncbi:MAG: hypothetical protein C5B55_14545 [Blastocatellia bacterium]|nr:MAG: hypothetical protein C5B55_14545 [Blastocatellia bacterium]
MFESEDMPIGTADMAMGSNAGSHLDPHALLNTEFISSGRSGDMIDEFVTQQIQPCFHCMMHSHQNSTLQTFAVNTTSYDSTVADSAVIIVTSLPAALSFVEVHDHGPPASSIPRYVLVAAFRI